MAMWRIPKGEKGPFLEGCGIKETPGAGDAERGFLGELAHVERHHRR